MHCGPPSAGPGGQGLLGSPGPLYAPACPAQNSLPGVFRAVSASGPTWPPQLHFSSGRGLPRESAEASEPLAAVSHHTRGAGSADLGSAPSCCWCQVLPSVASRVACPSSPPRHPPIQLRHLFFPWRHCPPSRETESSGGNRFRRLQWGGGETPQDQAGRGCLWGPLCLLGRAGSQPRRPALAGRGSPRLVPAGPGPPAAPAAAPPAAGSAPHPEQAGPGDGGGGHS